MYHDAALRALPPARTAWASRFLAELWRHLRKTYGSCAVPRDLPAPIGPNCERFGHPKPLIAFFHRNQFHGGTVASRFDAVAGFRDTIDVGDDGWNESSGRLHDVIAHEACHIVEFASQGVHGSPAFGVIWGDSKWAEICMYDFYVRSGRTADSQRVFKEFSDNRDNLPAGATDVAWFRDWFQPLWRESGGNMTFMDRFFGLLSRHFPKVDENRGRNRSYARRMTAGEFVHFMSGAVGRDLNAQAATVFNTGFSRAEFNRARSDFPGIDY